MKHDNIMTGQPICPNVPPPTTNKTLHPGRLTWNLRIAHLERKIIFQTSMIMFHVNPHGCIKGFLTIGFPSYPNQLPGFSAKLHPPFLQQILRFGTHLFRIRFLQKHLVFQRNETDKHPFNQGFIQNQAKE